LGCDADPSFSWPFLSVERGACTTAGCYSHDDDPRYINPALLTNYPNAYEPEPCFTSYNINAPTRRSFGSIDRTLLSENSSFLLSESFYTVDGRDFVTVLSNTSSNNDTDGSSPHASSIQSPPQPPSLPPASTHSPGTIDLGANTLPLLPPPIRHRCTLCPETFACPARLR